jgi:peroxiredoxin
VLAVSERRAEFGDTRIAVVTFTDPARLDAYRTHLGVDFPVVSDVDRSLYRALGLERGSLQQVWSLGTLRMYARLLRRGRRLTRHGNDDLRQLGADVIVDVHGRIVQIFRPSSPDARPTVDELLAALM